MNDERTIHTTGMHKPEEARIARALHGALGAGSEGIYCFSPGFADRVMTRIEIWRYDEAALGWAFRRVAGIVVALGIALTAFTVHRAPAEIYSSDIEAALGLPDISPGSAFFYLQSAGFLPEQT